MSAPCLYTSSTCRLCSEPSPNGYPLTNPDEVELVNKYLPLKVAVSDDGDLPQWICPGCNLQVEATIQFFGLVEFGQVRLAAMLEKEREQKLEVIEVINPNLLEVEDEEEDVLEGFQYFVEEEDSEEQIIVVEEQASKKKRGRPPKSTKLKLEECAPEVKEEETPVLTRSNRVVKLPERYKGTIQGRELAMKYDELKLQGKSPKPAEKEEFNAIIAHVLDPGGGQLGDVVAVKQENCGKKRSRFVCEVCKAVFTRESLFLNHRFSHKNIRYECIECVEPFMDQTQLEEHQKSENHFGIGIIENFVEEIVPPKTEDCGINIIVGSNGQITNILPVKEEPFEVSHFLTFPEDDNDPDDPQIPLDNRIPEKVRKFMCARCPKAFSTKEKIQRHQAAHSQERPFVCAQCGSAFKTKCNLKLHEVSHDKSKRLQCDQCDQTFALKQCLKIHMRLHSGDKPFKCDICNKSFGQRGNLLEHQRVHTGERPFACKVCAATFKTSSQCRQHMSRHNGRTLACPKCDKQFSQPGDLKAHMRRHSKHRPVFCNECGKAFPDQPALGKHMRTHTGEKPYSCTQCKRKFADASNFRKHLRVHAKRKVAAEVDFNAIFDLDLSNVSDPEPDAMTPPPTTFDLSARAILDEDSLENVSSSNVWSMIEADSFDRSRALPDVMQEQTVNTDLNKVVCISYPDPMNPVDSKTTFYIME